MNVACICVCLACYCGLYLYACYLEFYISYNFGVIRFECVINTSVLNNYTGRARALQCSRRHIRHDKSAKGPSNNKYAALATITIISCVNLPNLVKSLMSQRAKSPMSLKLETEFLFYENVEM